MEKNRKIIYVISAVVFILLSVLVAFLLNKEKSVVEYDEKPIAKEDIEKPENYELTPNSDNYITICDMEKDDIYAFSFTDAKGVELSFHLDNEQWIFDEDPEIDLNDEYVDGLIADLCTIRCLSIHTDFEDSKIDFQNPNFYYTLSDASGNTTTISIYAAYASEGKYFFIINDSYSVVYETDSSLIKISENTLGTMDSQ